MDLNSYNNLVSNLSNSTQYKQQPPPVIDDQINFMKETVKNTMETIGGGFTGDAVQKTIKNLRKSGKNLGLSEEEMSGLEESAGSGDVTGGAGQVVRIGINRITNMIRPPAEIQNPVQQIQELNTRPDLSDLPNKFSPEQGSNVEENVGDDVFDRSTFENPTGNLDSTKLASQASTEDLQNMNEIKDQENDIDKAGQDMKDLKDLDEGETIVKDLNEGEKLSAGADEDPINLAITAGLGLAGLIGGLFIKTHHTVNIIPKIDPDTTGFGTSLGTG